MTIHLANGLDIPATHVIAESKAYADDFVLGVISNHPTPSIIKGKTETYDVKVHDSLFSLAEERNADLYVEVTVRYSSMLHGNTLKYGSRVRYHLSRNATKYHEFSFW